MSYPIVQDLLTNNRPYIKFTPVGAVVHATAVPGATAKNIRDSFQNHPDRPASAHVTIDWNEIRQMVPWNEEAWHACKTGNKLYLGCELCQPAQHDPVKFQAVWDRAVWFYAYWLKDVLEVTKVTIDNLLSHAEVTAKYHESTHTDPVAYFAEYGKTVDQFRAAVQAEINGIKKEEKPKVKNLVCYGKKEDKPAAEMLAYRLQCPVMDADIPFDYSTVENVYCVGAPGHLPFTSYAKQIIAGSGREDTMQKILNFKVG